MSRSSPPRRHNSGSRDLYESLKEKSHKSSSSGRHCERSSESHREKSDKPRKHPKSKHRSPSQDKKERHLESEFRDSKFSKRDRSPPVEKIRLELGDKGRKIKKQSEKLRSPSPGLLADTSRRHDLVSEYPDPGDRSNRRLDLGRPSVDGQRRGISAEQLPSPNSYAIVDVYAASDSASSNVAKDLSTASKGDRHSAPVPVDRTKWDDSSSGGEDEIKATRSGDDRVAKKARSSSKESSPVVNRSHSSVMSKKKNKERRSSPVAYSGRTQKHGGGARPRSPSACDDLRDSLLDDGVDECIPPTKNLSKKNDDSRRRDRHERAKQLQISSTKKIKSIFDPISPIHRDDRSPSPLLLDRKHCSRGNARSGHELTEPFRADRRSPHAFGESDRLASASRDPPTRDAFRPSDSSECMPYRGREDFDRKRLGDAYNDNRGREGETKRARHGSPPTVYGFRRSPDHGGGRRRSRDRESGRNTEDRRPPPRKITREMMIEQLLRGKGDTLDVAPAENMVEVNEVPSDLPLSEAKGGQQRRIAQLSAKAQALAGVSLPKYYNPAAVNPLKYAEQVQKRKLLWQGSKEKKVSSNWQEMVAAAGDEKSTEKLKKLIGFKNDGSSEVDNSGSAVGGPSTAYGEAASLTSGGHRDASGTPSSLDSSNVKQRQSELFKTLDHQYEVARMSTHMHRGLGLGFTSRVQEALAHAASLQSSHDGRSGKS